MKGIRWILISFVVAFANSTLYEYMRGEHSFFEIYVIYLLTLIVVMLIPSVYNKE